MAANQLYYAMKIKGARENLLSLPEHIESLEDLAQAAQMTFSQLLALFVEYGPMVIAILNKLRSGGLNFVTVQELVAQYGSTVWDILSKVFTRPAVPATPAAPTGDAGSGGGSFTPP